MRLALLRLLAALLGLHVLSSLTYDQHASTRGAVAAEASAHCPGSPNQCSLHGTCVLNRLGERVCNCQWGYNGGDCSKKMCPHGFDPDDTVGREKKLLLTIAASSAAALRGKFVLTFHSHSVEFDAPLESVTSEACTHIFRRFQNIGEVSCSRVEFEAPSRAVFEVTLHSFPVYPVMNNLYHHNGNPPASDFWCDATNATPTRAGSDVSCAFRSKSDADIKEYAPCSGRGVCNERIGVCTCQGGYYGENCGNNKDEEDVLVAPSTGPFFKGNVLRVSAKRAKSPEFNLIKADVQGRATFSVNGDGDTTLHAGSLLVKEGDLVVESGQAQIRSGGRLVMVNADIQVTNAQIRVQQATRDGAAKYDAMLLLEMQAESVSTDFVRLFGPRGPVFRVSGSGTTVIDDGGLEVQRGGVKVQRGGVHVLSGGIAVSHGALTIQNGALNLQSGSLRVSDGHASFASSSAKLPALDVARQPKTEAAAGGSSGVLELHSELENDTLILAKGRHDVRVFQVKATGEAVVHTGGLLVEAGGVRIKSGGQTITSGGLHIEAGGALIEGELTTTGGLVVQDGGFTVRNNAANNASLRVLSTNAHFGGALLAFDLSGQMQQQQQQPTHPFRLLEALGARDEPIVSVDSRGNVVTRGDITTTASGKIVSSGALVSQAQVVFAHVKIPAGAEIRIPSSHSYVKITDDGAAARNRVTMDTGDAYAGQLLVLQNEDAQSLGGDVSVKPSAAAMFVFDGAGWRALTAASFDTAVLTGVTSFEAANDLNLGDVKLTAKHVQVAGQKAGLVAVYGKGGELAQHDALAFDAASGTLAAHRLRAEVIEGSIDMSGSELRHVEIVGGHISNVNLTSVERMEVDGELFVELDAFFGSGITVDGPVMGSGAYVDASDARFKRDVAPIRGALELLGALEGVEYAYRADEFPAKRFSRARELGLIAQDVEQVLPQVVVEDARGFKYVAYARLVPVVVEALKQLRRETAELKASVDTLRGDVTTLKQLVETLQLQAIGALTH
ncbi:hypothetical protein PybrP1_000642 [[Pythium] brassicae (nom. inval.)]|nr:hypothetical protein PybrP1_000642 [[Pythium] brassicae (nom. inval.)]